MFTSKRFHQIRSTETTLVYVRPNKQIEHHIYLKNDDKSIKKKNLKQANANAGLKNS